MNGTPKIKSRWRHLRRALTGLAMVVTLVALAVTEEDWRGKHAWESYRHYWESKGEKFYGRDFTAPVVPADQNFLTAPIVTNLLSDKIVMIPWRSDGSSPEKAGGSWQKSTLTDLKAWQTFYRNPASASEAGEFPMTPQPQTPARDILFALGKYDSAIAELRVASQRPYANVLMNYNVPCDEGIANMTPWFMALKRCTQTLELRTLAELADGQSDHALADVKLMLSLDNSIRSSPFLISHLVHIAIVNITLQPIYEGLAEHQWSDKQLVDLDAELAKLDFLADYELCIHGERAYAIDYFENLRQTREMISNLPDGSVTNKLTWVPIVWFYQNELNISRVYQERLLPQVDMNLRVVSPENVKETVNDMQAERKWYAIYKLEALMTAAGLENAVRKFAFTQESIDLARVACALERYRLAHGEYPETLAPLAPQFIAQLPHDIINSQPLHYRRDPGGQFVLYSVGWNETDDGGVVVIDKKHGTLILNEGDWVWKYPEK